MLYTIREIVAGWFSTEKARKAKAGQFFDMNEAGAARLKTLRSYEEWGDYTNLLDVVAKLYAEQLLTREVTSEDVHYLRGVVVGIRRAGTLVDEIKVQELARGADDARREQLGERSARRAESALYGTPFYERTG